MSKDEKNKSILSRSMLFIVNLTIVLFAFVALFITSFNIIFMSTSVKGYSMLPTLNSTVPTETTVGDAVYINRFFQGSRGNIVVAEVNWHGVRTTVIKRLVAMGGDRVNVFKNAETVFLSVNDKIVNQKNLSENAAYINMYNQYVEYKENNLGKFNSDGSLVLADSEAYIMGDNWASSSDSSLYGPVDKSCIVGRVDIVIPYQKNVYSILIKRIINIFKI